MTRRIPLVVAIALLALACSDPTTTEARQAELQQSADAVPPSETATPGPPADDPVVQSDDPDKQPAPGASDDAGVRVLPDPQRWVVVDDWASRSPATTSAGTLQLDAAPLSAEGVPDLGRRISLNYRFGPVEDFEREWGDASALGDPTDFELEDGIARSVSNAEFGFATALVWIKGTFVSMQTEDPDADLIDLAESLMHVDETTWQAARSGAEGQRLIAIEAAMQRVEPVAPIGEPMPHWVLPSPWEVEWVTDKTIWTDEQQRQAVAFVEANRPAHAPTQTQREFRSWHFGFGDTADSAAAQFVPHVSVYISILDEPSDPGYPTNYETISALGLDGVISFGSAELGSEALRVTVQAPRLDEAHLRAFLAAAEFARDDPLDGLVVADPRFQLLDVEEWDQRPPSWHAAYAHPDAGDAFVSVWRLSVPELRAWMIGRGRDLTVPDEVWATIAAGGTINFDSHTADATYEVPTGLLMILRNIERGDLIPISVEDWIELVEPVNTDPLNPR